MSDTTPSPRKHRPVALIIRDGWGISPNGPDAAETEGNAPILAHTPYHDEVLFKKYPQATLTASGEAVGLPAGQMGNSEVGHLNLGAGRIVYQDFLRINNAIRDGELASNETLQALLADLKASGKALHLWGLLSDGGVHSHEKHLYALIEVARDAGVQDIYVHAFMDGRDTSPTGGAQYLANLLDEMKRLGAGRLATMVGRYYAMDRDQRWDRTKIAYDLVYHGIGEKADDPVAKIKEYYDAGTTDEFLPATVFLDSPRPLIQDGDGILFFNFRSDRGRQLSRPTIATEWEHFDRGNHPKIQLVTMTVYDKTYENVPVLFPPQTLNDNLGEAVAAAGLKQLRMAETEKYPHVTFFFNSGIEQPNNGEDRAMADSPRDVKTYDEKPEMSAIPLTDTCVEKLSTGEYDLLILNFANPDMVGHTGSLEAAIKACETIDQCTQRVVEKILELGGCALITADHGNCEFMKNADGSPHTAHTTNLVHFIYVGNDSDSATVESGILGDVAPTLLHLLGVPKPDAMTGRTLVTFS